MRASWTRPVLSPPPPTFSLDDISKAEMQVIQAALDLYTIRGLAHQKEAARQLYNIITDILSDLRL